MTFLIWRHGLPYPAANIRGRGGFLNLATLMTCLAGLAMWLVALAEGAPWRPTHVALTAQLAIVLSVQLLGAAAEEVGWRGLVLPLLETRLAAWAAAVITGLLFGLGHFYLAFAVPPASFGLFVVSAVALSLILALATVGRAWWERIAIATALHFLVNAQTFFLFSDGDGGALYFGDLAAAFAGPGLMALWLLAQRRTVTEGNPFR